ncbi:MAG: hypothetical protein ACU843_04170 [Gammaproteobacteria bacterium]
MAAKNPKIEIDDFIKPSALLCGDDQASGSDRNEIFAKLLDEAIENETGLTAEDRKEALELLQKGQFATDLANLVIVAISTIPNLAQTLPQTGEEINRLPETLRECWKHEKNCADPLELKKAAQHIYDNPTLEVQRATLVALLKNKTFRLALIVYARSNGVNLDNRDLDFVQAQLERKDIDIQAFVEDAKTRLKEKFGVEKIEGRLACLEQSS